MTSFAILPSRFVDGKYVPSPTSREVVSTTRIETEFFNLKNKAAGARRYGYLNTVTKFTNPDGSYAYRFELQTTLDGQRYQSSKYGDLLATEDEANAALIKAVAGAMKRYAKLATKPGSGIERRA